MIDKISETIKLSCIQASLLVMKIYRISGKKNGKKNLNLTSKSDGSPITEADRLANKLIEKNLKNFFPNLPIVSEESNQKPKQNINSFFLVDPLDGTKEFLNSNGEFTINIGYVCNNKPMLGAVCHPTTNRIFWTENNYAWSENYYFTKEKNISFSNKKKLICKKKKKGNSVIISRTHLDSFTKSFLQKKKIYKNKKTWFFT